ncbi:MAG: cephalosporin hydroxylase family protein [Nocardioidaceae bacterium]|nr:cephalosporin hydroxylase family protein [Nocardioidaceae bacterium]
MSSPFESLSRQWMEESVRERYSYNFTWLGRPVIQYPQDMIAIQELIWRIRPQVIVETGIAHGGSLVFSASMLELIGGPGRVIGVDIDIREHNREALDEHPLRHRMRLLEGSSIDSDIVRKVHEEVGDAAPVLVILDSMHTHDHVLAELRAYSPLVSAGSYVVVLDTVIADLPDDLYPDRPWTSADNPRTAAAAFVAESSRFEVDTELERRLAITTAPGGYLRCMQD